MLFENQNLKERIQTFTGNVWNLRKYCKDTEVSLKQKIDKEEKIFNNTKCKLLESALNEFDKFYDLKTDNQLAESSKYKLVSLQPEDPNYNDLEKLRELVVRKIIDEESTVKIHKIKSLRSVSSQPEISSIILFD